MQNVNNAHLQYIYCCTLPVNASSDTTEPSELEHRYNVSEMWNSQKTKSIQCVHIDITYKQVHSFKAQCTLYLQRHTYPEKTGQQKSGENTESKWHSTYRATKEIYYICCSHAASVPSCTFAVLQHHHILSLYMLSVDKIHVYT